MEAYGCSHSLPTNVSDGIREEKPDGFQPTMGKGKPFPQNLPDAEAFIVEFDGEGDPWEPFNWSSWTKYVLAIGRGPHLIDR